jgi:DNA-binding NarL/FixJ family response regulator
MATLQILIAEDHSIVRLGTILLIREIYPAAAVTECSTFHSALEHLSRQTFDLLILDINIPGGNSTMMIENVHLRQKDIPILVLSSYPEDIYAIRYLKAGAMGYLEKESEPTVIQSAIQKVIHREVYASDAVQQQLFTSLSFAKKDKGADYLKDLSNREIEIMRLLAKGISPTEIKNRLHIQLSTISTHKARIFQKMEVNNVVELADKLRLLDEKNSHS